MYNAERKLRNEKICEMLKQGKTRKELAEIFGLSLPQINNIIVNTNGITRQSLKRKGKYHYDS